jgi:hypothetical protein
MLKIFFKLAAQQMDTILKMGPIVPKTLYFNSMKKEESFHGRSVT